MNSVAKGVAKSSKSIGPELTSSKDAPDPGDLDDFPDTLGTWKQSGKAQ